MLATERIKRVLSHPLMVSLVLPFALIQFSGLLASLVRDVGLLGAPNASADAFGTVYGLSELLVALAYAVVLVRVFGLRLGLQLNGVARCLLLLLPTLGIIALQLSELLGSRSSVFATSSSRLFSCLTVALGAGLFEELAWRAGSIGICMRRWESLPWRDDAALLLSSISFGFIHLANLLHGADLPYTLAQTFYTCGLGCVTGAAYLRTRNLLAPIVVHVAIDFFSLAASGEEVVATINQTAGAETILLLVRLGAVMLVWGLFCVRPSKRAQIAAAWPSSDELGRIEMAKAEDEFLEMLYAQASEAEGERMGDANEQTAGGENLEKIRRHYRFVGQVQGVGFRFTMTALADRAGATGWVMNEPDGSVTAEIQGNEEQVAAVIGGLTQHFNRGRRWFSGFTIDDVRDVNVIRGELDFRPIY